MAQITRVISSPSISTMVFFALGLGPALVSPLNIGMISSGRPLRG
jgi:hypothetical protein